MSNRLSHSLLSGGFLVACLALAKAQDMPIVIAGWPLQSQQVGVMQSQPSQGPIAHSNRKEMGFQFVGAEPAVSAQIVKGAPYSLEATVDTEQTLADGNRIAHHQVVHVYRDSEGRTRREETLAAIGPWAASGTPPTLVTIQDPVSGATYSLDPKNKIATKLPIGLSITYRTTGVHTVAEGVGISTSPADAKSPVSDTVFYTGAIGAGGVAVQDGIASATAKPDETSESIGKDTIAGFSADGLRLTTIIPAETMGNERPIEITRERWFSPELQIVLRSKQTDPRFGVTTYEVTRLDRASPAHSLFEIPRDYKIRNAPRPPLPPAPPK